MAKSIPAVDAKYCTDCNELKPLSDFYRSKSARDGFKHYCKICSRARISRWRSENADHLKKKRRERTLAMTREDREKKRAQDRDAYRRDPEKARDTIVKSKFNLSPEQYREMVESQGGVCAVCLEECISGRRLAVDHDRSCCPGDKSCGKCVRGLLCANCNRAIGLMRDERDRLLRAADYLAKYSTSEE